MVATEEHNKAIENLNEKLLENLNERSTLATYLLSTISKITNSDQTRQFKLVKDTNSERVIDLLIKKQYQLLQMTNCQLSVIQTKSLC